MPRRSISSRRSNSSVSGDNLFICQIAERVIDLVRLAKFLLTEPHQHRLVAGQSGLTLGLSQTRPTLRPFFAEKWGKTILDRLVIASKNVADFAVARPIERKLGHLRLIEFQESSPHVIPSASPRHPIAPPSSAACSIASIFLAFKSAVAFAWSALAST
jgi:hypothetical protein